MEGEQLRNLRDFLLVYNKMTELCFSRCAKNLNYRSLTMDEEQCLDSCASKFIRSNHRLMGAYVGLMPAVVQRRMADYESLNKEVSINAMPNTETSLEVSPESSTALPDGGSNTDVSSAESIQSPQ
ncbi:mitochondrial import inner membrane translocase subunit Tim10 B [Pseudophryne corroboree]|uniref:mitochondrial import inner membrane translocase subunit Tim10 B n=1 Tax=Pseudophryne corroboree TaxID=495146 RepID=UPI0030819697